jgi:hypothetical protein|tara:strand:+ start:38 stop:172 length:135 start_codon:yes stop_codon:yes gene_type:complete
LEIINIFFIYAPPSPLKGEGDGKVSKWRGKKEIESMETMERKNA